MNTNGVKTIVLFHLGSLNNFRPGSFESEVPISAGPGDKNYTNL
jgi:hypothetical protein